MTGTHTEGKQRKGCNKTPHEVSWPAFSCSSEPKATHQTQLVLMIIFDSRSNSFCEAVGSISEERAFMAWIDKGAMSLSFASCSMCISGQELPGCQRFWACHVLKYARWQPSLQGLGYSRARQSLVLGVHSPAGALCHSVCSLVFWRHCP